MIGLDTNVILRYLLQDDPNLAHVPAKIVGAEALDPDLLGRSLDYRPDRSVGQGLPFDLVAFENRAQEEEGLPYASISARPIS